jgi:hypothetical protein
MNTQLLISYFLSPKSSPHLTVILIHNYEPLLNRILRTGFCGGGSGSARKPARMEIRSAAWARIQAVEEPYGAQPLKLSTN